MAFIPSIQVSQSALTPAVITVLDNSTGTDAAIASRRISVQDANGNYLVVAGTTTTYNPWPLINLSITLNILKQDECVNIINEWLDASNIVLYTYENQYPLAEFNKQFLVYLVQLQGLTPGIVQDSNYSGNIAVFWANIIAGINQVNFGADIGGGQNCFNRATNMRLKEADFF